MDTILGLSEEVLDKREEKRVSKERWVVLGSGLSKATNRVWVQNAS